MPIKKTTEKVHRAFDLSKWDNIDISDDETTFHPNIENNFNIKINRTVRDRKEKEDEEKVKELLAKGTPEALREMERIERNKKWHVGNMCDVKEEKTIINEYKKDPPKKVVEFAPSGASDAELEGYFPWKEEHIELLEEFVALGGDMEATHVFLKKNGDKLLSEDVAVFAHTFCMMETLNAKVAYDEARAKKAAQQSNCISTIMELAKSFKRPIRDLVNQWFQKVEENPVAFKVYEDEYNNFLLKVTKMADEKRERLKQEAEEEEKRKQSETTWVAKKMGENNDYKKVDGEGNVEDMDEEQVGGEAQPLVKAMYQMTKEQRLQLAPGGLDPLEVFESLPTEMRAAFDSGDVQELVKLQETMPPAQFGECLHRCIQAGLWNPPPDEPDEMGEDEASPSASKQ